MDLKSIPFVGAVFRWAHELKQARQQDAARRKKLDELFQEGNTVRALNSGVEYKVQARDVGAVWLRSDAGRYRLLGLVTGAGTLRLAVADNWERVA